MSIVTIIGSGMMGSALAFPARENGNTVRLVGTPLDKDIIEDCRKTGQHTKFDRPFPEGVEYFQIEECCKALKNADLVICGVSSFGVDWFAETVLPILPPDVPVLSVTKGLICQEDGTLISYPQFWQKKLDELKKTNEIITANETIPIKQENIMFFILSAIRLEKFLTIIYLCRI